jgi:hypothetical protein
MRAPWVHSVQSLRGWLLLVVLWRWHGAQGWGWQPASLAGQVKVGAELHDVAVVPGTDTWFAVGSNNTLLRSADGALSWTDQGASRHAHRRAHTDSRCGGGVGVTPERS